MIDLSREIRNAERRVYVAKTIADRFKGDDRLHRLAMQSVFVLEDVLFALRELAEKPGDDKDKHSPGA